MAHTGTLPLARLARALAAASDDLAGAAAASDVATMPDLPGTLGTLAAHLHGRWRGAARDGRAGAAGAARDLGELAGTVRRAAAGYRLADERAGRSVETAARRRGAR